MSSSMRQWDIVNVRINPARDIDSHPAVLISADETCADERQFRVNVLFGSKKSPASATRRYAVLLNSADGLEFMTEIDCGFVHVVSKEKILGTAGRVTPVRQREIMRKVFECWRFRL
jgi:hypothetical protein